VGPEDLPRGVAESRPSASRAAAKITRILVEKRGENRLRHIVANHEISVSRTEVPAIPCSSLPKRSVRIRQLALSAENCRQADRASIEGILGSNLEFLGRCKWRVVMPKIRLGSVGDGFSLSLLAAMSGPVVLRTGVSWPGQTTANKTNAITVNERRWSTWFNPLSSRGAVVLICWRDRRT